MSSGWVVAAAVLIGLPLVSYTVEWLRRAPVAPERLSWAPTIPAAYLTVGGTRLRYITAGQGPALVLCDCNAKPDSPELKLITESGFGDLALQSGGGGNTFSSDDPHERIDYVFGVGVTASQGHVVDSTASDHKGLVVMVTLAAR